LVLFWGPKAPARGRDRRERLGLDRVETRAERSVTGLKARSPCVTSGEPGSPHDEGGTYCCQICSRVRHRPRGSSEALPAPRRGRGSPADAGTGTSGWSALAVELGDAGSEGNHERSRRVPRAPGGTPYLTTVPLAATSARTLSRRAPPAAPPPSPPGRPERLARLPAGRIRPRRKSTTLTAGLGPRLSQVAARGRLGPPVGADGRAVHPNRSGWTRSYTHPGVVPEGASRRQRCADRKEPEGIDSPLGFQP
jgi:hypothetical protein